MIFFGILQVVPVLGINGCSVADSVQFKINIVVLLKVLSRIGIVYYKVIWMAMVGHIEASIALSPVSDRVWEEISGEQGNCL